MALLDVIRGNLRRSIDLYQELVAAIPEAALGDKLPGLRSNTVGQQLWCVIGARESYRRAIEAGDWKGFSCSVAADRCSSRQALERALSTSGSGLLDVLSGADSFSDRQWQLLLDLLEHEAAHQGQLIRYFYALHLPVPDGWKARYALD